MDGALPGRLRQGLEPTLDFMPKVGPEVLLTRVTKIICRSEHTLVMRSICGDLAWRIAALPFYLVAADPIV